MVQESDLYTAHPRPDLEEFLSALDGFLAKESSPSDPSYYKFLGIFCRSIGAAEGHLLRKDEGGRLQSVVLFGMAPKFNTQFNEAAQQSKGDSPLDDAFNKKEVIAIIELAKHNDVPPWFMNLMNENTFRSLVAVPLIGQTEVAGILCAYYHDVCLFDQGTLDHLMMIGRMVGAAIEKDAKSNLTGARIDRYRFVDALLKTFIQKPLAKIEIFSEAAKVAKEAVAADGVLMGPLRKTPEGLELTLAGVAGVSKKFVSRRILLPAFIEKYLTKPNQNKIPTSIKSSDWGEFKGLFGDNSARPLIKPLLWRNKMMGLIISWRTGSPGFDSDNVHTLERIASITTLALRSE